ncbi:MAG: 4-(cytidine 5'-diphospho)-2-C-methyl-D-erythritol kinase [Actinomycetota bacterium]|nr:4-(cytidine 5'-diphospho)-2-C-methyl-D-erythritol kinase [Actinomycetota bacterium]
MKVTAAAPAKINLQLSVGALRADGYHDLVTVYQALDLRDEVTIFERAEGMGVQCGISGDFSSGVPGDESNLAVKAVKLVAELAGVSCDLNIQITKRIPVAAGLAGGSADAAAALVVAAELYGYGGDLQPLAEQLGSDVAFSLLGGTALGTSRGEVVVPVLARGNYCWVIISSSNGLSTPRVYQKLDQLRDEGAVREPLQLAPKNELLQALVSGSATEIAAHLSNDLQPAALALAPKLQRILDVAVEDGALASLVAGSGPTCIALAKDHDHALDIAARISGQNLADRVLVATSPAAGTEITAIEKN